MEQDWSARVSKLAALNAERGHRLKHALLCVRSINGRLVGLNQQHRAARTQHYCGLATLRLHHRAAAVPRPVSAVS